MAQCVTVIRNPKDAVNYVEGSEEIEVVFKKVLGDYLGDTLDKYKNLAPSTVGYLTNDVVVKRTGVKIDDDLVKNEILRDETEMVLKHYSDMEFVPVSGLDEVETARFDELMAQNNDKYKDYSDTLTLKNSKSVARATYILGSTALVAGVCAVGFKMAEPHLDFATNALDVASVGEKIGYGLSAMFTVIGTGMLVARGIANMVYNPKIKKAQAKQDESYQKWEEVKEEFEALTAKKADAEKIENMNADIMLKKSRAHMINDAIKYSLA